MSKKLTKKQQQFKEQWEIVQETYSITETERVPIVKELVRLGDELQGQICDSSDSYKIDIHKEVSEKFTNLSLKTKTWVDLVTLRRKKKHGLINPKLLTKIRKGLNKSAYIIALKKVHVQHYDEDMPQSKEPMRLPVVNDDADIDIQAFEFSQDAQDFIELVETAADIQHKIVQELHPRMSDLRGAFAYITGKSTSDFKILVDSVHYRYGGYPSEKSPPRHWAPFKRYRQLNELFDEYEFDHAKMWNKRFGLTVQVAVHKHFTWSTHTKAAILWQNINLFKVTIERYKPVASEFRQLGIETWHVLAFIDEHCCIIDEGTGIIDNVIDNKILARLVTIHEMTTSLPDFNVDNTLQLGELLLDDQKDVATALIEKLENNNK